MQATESPAVSAVPRRVLGQQLRELRLQAGLTTAVAARLMEWSEPKLWRIETGQTGLRALDAQAMCATYGAPPRRTQALAALARHTRAQGWWHSHDQAIPDDFSIYTALEDAACRLVGYAPAQVPGLLRTEPYARALTAISGLSNRDVDRLVYDCLARRRLLTRHQAPLEMALVVDEALAHRPVGGPQTMAGQLRLLAELAALPTVSLRVLPRHAAQHPGLATGAFTLLEFPPTKRDEDTDTAIVHAAGLTGELFLDKPYEVSRYREAHAAIHGCALDETTSADFLFSAAKELDR
jgi:transcriptional regulator with XRE-family HTH domain